MLVDTSGLVGGPVSPDSVGSLVWRRAPSPPVGSGAVCKNEARGLSESFISLGNGEKCLKVTDKRIHEAPPPFFFCYST